MASFYIRKLARQLRTYVAHCPQCQLHRTGRHSPYGSLRPIQSPAIPFHTVTIDFILALPVTTGGYDTILTVTCKFSKRVLLIAGKSTWSAEQWADAFLAAVLGHDWGVARAIVSDRDRKFMSDFWRGVFRRLGTELLVSTAYHAQTDGQSERTNKTVEIALRYWITSNPGIDFTEGLPYIQAGINNTVAAATGHTPNEICYGFRLQDNLGLLSDMPAEDWSKLSMHYREIAEESIAWAGMVAKTYYDGKHTPIDLREGSQVYLRLHHGYTIPGISNKKLSPQRVGPFKILKKVGPLAYRLELPPTMAIHPVISVAQLEPVPESDDPYSRPRPDQERPPPVEMEGADDPAPQYEIERLLDKRISRGKVQYLVKWQGYGPADNVWYNMDDLANARDLVDEYEQHAALRPGLSARARRRRNLPSPVPSSVPSPAPLRRSSRRQDGGREESGPPPAVRRSSRLRNVEHGS